MKNRLINSKTLSKMYNHQIWKGQHDEPHRMSYFHLKRTTWLAACWGRTHVSIEKDKRNVIFIRSKNSDRRSECQRARKMEKEKLGEKTRASSERVSIIRSYTTALCTDNAFLIVNGISNYLIPQITIPSAVIIIRYEVFHVWNVACMLPA